MALLQPRLNLKVAQKQVLTPGLVQMVSLLALNKQELKEMIDAEILENPVLEQLEDSESHPDESASPEDGASEDDEKPKESDPFDDIDFGSYFQDYLDPGYRTPHSSEISEKPSFENFLSKPTTLTDHLMWQLGSLHLPAGVRDAAELVIGNLNEDGYLAATDEELLAALHQGELPEEEVHAATSGQSSVLTSGDSGVDGHGVHSTDRARSGLEPGFSGSGNNHPRGIHFASFDGGHPVRQDSSGLDVLDSHQKPASMAESPNAAAEPGSRRRDLDEALQVVRRLDPVGIAARDLRECLLIQLDLRIEEAGESHDIHLAASAEPAADESPSFDSPVLDRTAQPGPDACGADPAMALARRIIDEFLPHLLKRDLRELSKLTGHASPDVQVAIETIRALDPRPGQRYNREQPRLIEPDVAFVKRDDEYVIVINDEEVPMLRLNRGYRRMMTQEGTDREVRDYVKERYRSAIQLMRNIEQRRNTILRTCEAIVRRQRDFLEDGVDALKPMMIKEVAEEIGVHASTVSRAVANKYVHTPQGVFELRYFFSEGVNGPEGADTPLPLLKRKVRKMIEEEDPHKPLTDDSIAHLLQSQGIKVNRRTIAKYREDMGIPSTHQRRVRI